MDDIEITERTIKYLEALDRAIERLRTWYNRLEEQDDTEGDTEARKVEKETLETVSRIFDEEVGKEAIVKEEREEFSEATIKVIREREDKRQRKILHVFEVGLVQDKMKKVEAPTAEAAALFYGLNTTGEQLSAEVYTMDGEEYEGDKKPLFRYLFYQKWVGELKEKLEEVKPLLELCRFLKEGEG